MKPLTLTVARCEQEWAARRSLKFYAEPFEPTPFGPDGLTYRVEEGDGEWLVAGRNAAAMEALSAS